MAAPVSGIFWLHFYGVGGSGDASSIFIYNLWLEPINKANSNKEGDANIRSNTGLMKRSHENKFH